MSIQIKVDGVNITLTKEQLAEIDKQRGINDKGLPMTWEQAIKTFDNKTMYFIEENADIENIPEFDGSVVGKLDQNNVGSEKQAKSVLAYCKLLTIVSALNKSVEVQKVDNKDQWMIYYDWYGDHGFQTICYCDEAHLPFSLETEELAQHLIDHFSDLLKEFFMI